MQVRSILKNRLVRRESSQPRTRAARIAAAASGHVENPLLRLTAGRDNGAMETKPPEADPPKRKRRWFQFSLRTLMIVVTVLAVV